jgi:hypothetical protein
MISGEARIASSEEKKPAENAEVPFTKDHGFIKPYAVVSNLIGDSKLAEKKRIKSLGFEVLDIEYDGEVAYEVGEEVLARRGGGANDPFVLGCISKVHYLDADDHEKDVKPIRKGYYDVAYIDGSTENSVYYRSISDAIPAVTKQTTALSQFKVGESVQVWYHGSGPWKEGSVDSLSGDNSFCVQYTDGSSESGVPGPWIRSHKPASVSTFELGEAVKVRRSGSSAWSDAVILKDNGANFTVGYLKADFTGDLRLSVGGSKLTLTLSAVSSGLKLEILPGQMLSSGTLTASNIEPGLIISNYLGENAAKLQEFSVEKVDRTKFTQVNLTNVSMKSFDVEIGIPPSSIRSISKPPDVFNVTTQSMTAIVCPNKYLVTKIVVADEIGHKVLKDPSKYHPKYRARIVQAALDRYKSSD